MIMSEIACAKSPEESARRSCRRSDCEVADAQLGMLPLRVPCRRPAGHPNKDFLYLGNTTAHPHVKSCIVAFEHRNATFDANFSTLQSQFVKCIDGRNFRF